MADKFAARFEDQIIHTSLWADIAAIAMEAAVYAAAGIAVAAAAAAAGPLLAGAGLAAAGSAAAAAAGGSCVISGLVAGLAINIAGLGDEISDGCASLASAIFPPSPAGTISSGSPNVFTNGKNAARAAGRLLTEKEISQLPPESEENPQSFQDYASVLLNIGKVFLSQMVSPTVDGPSGPVDEAPDDKVKCEKHSPEQYLAEGSSKVTINDRPAVRADDRTTCEAKVSTDVSPNVIIGGDAEVVRPINSGKLPGLDLAFMAVSLVRGKPSKMLKRLPCMLAMAGAGMLVNRLGNAINATFFPVHAATGAKVLAGDEDLDFTLPARYPLRWQRIYNSRNPHAGLFGTGWRTEFETQVVCEDGMYCYHDVSGRELRFDCPEPGVAAYSPAEGLLWARGEQAQLVIGDADGSCWRLYLPHPSIPGVLRLTVLSDEYGNGLVCHYDEHNRLVRMNDTETSLHVQLHYRHPHHPQRVTSITEQYSDGQLRTLATYDYSQAGDLVRVTDAAAVTTRTFGWTPEHLLAWHELPSGLRSEYVWRKFDDWRVVENRTSAGSHCCLEYDLEQGMTTVRDELHFVRRHYWNAQYQPERYTDEAGNDWCYRWNDDGLLTESVDPQGQRWQYRYDGAGNLTEEEDPLGRVTLTTWLPHRSLPVLVISPGGARERYYYDNCHGLKAHQDALGQTTRYERDTFGQVIRMTDVNGGISHFSYNVRGQLTESRDCSGQPTRYCYDDAYRLKEVTDAQDESLYYCYDAAGRPVEVKGPEGWRHRLEWDVRGHLVAEMWADGTQAQYEWDVAGRLSVTRNPRGGEVTRRYDSRGRLVGLDNENQESYHFVWGVNDRLLEEHGLDGVVTRYDYDNCDKPVRCTFAADTPSAMVHQTIYDAAGQIIVRVTPDGETRFRYAPSGLLLEVAFVPAGDTSPSQTLLFDYDAAGRLLAEAGVNGQVSYQYDPLDNRTAVTLPDGRRLKTLYYGSGHALQMMLDDRCITEFTRDALHREIRRIQGVLSSHLSYDRLGRLSHRSVRLAPYPTRPEMEQSWHYDLRHNLTREQQNISPYKWRDYHYDAEDRLLERRSDAVSPETWFYDPASNIMDRESREGHCRHNRVTKYRDIHYRYDIFGRTVEKTRNGERWCYEYNSKHQLIKVVRYPRQRHDPVQHIHFEYDPLGRRTRKYTCYVAPQQYPQHAADEAASETRFIWEGLRLLAEVRDGVPLVYVYEAQDSYTPLARIDGRGDDTRIHYFHCQPNGLPELMTDAQGHEYWRGNFNSWGKVSQEMGQARAENREQNLRFQGQYLDRETGLHYNLFRYYDPDIGRFSQPDPIGLAGGINLYAYAPNPLSWIDPLGLLNEFGIAGYGSALHVKDGLTAHELLQNAWLRNNGITTGRMSGIATSNPAIALQENAMHKTISKLQARYGLHDPNVLKNQTALQNINRNTAITRRGIYEDLVNNRGWEPQNAKKFATDTAMKLRDESIGFAKKNGLMKC